MDKPVPTLNPQMASLTWPLPTNSETWGSKRALCCPGHTALLGGWDQGPRFFPAPAAHDLPEHWAHSGRQGLGGHAWLGWGQGTGTTCSLTSGLGGCVSG